MTPVEDLSILLKSIPADDQYIICCRAVDCYFDYEIEFAILNTIAERNNTKLIEFNHDEYEFILRDLLEQYKTEKDVYKLVAKHDLYKDIPKNTEILVPRF